MTCVPRRCDWMPLWTGEGEAEMDKNSIVGHHGSGGGEGGRTKRAAKWGLIQLGAHHRAKTFLCTRHTQHSLAHTHKHTHTHTHTHTFSRFLELSVSVLFLFNAKAQTHKNIILIYTQMCFFYFPYLAHNYESSYNSDLSDILIDIK